MQKILHNFHSFAKYRELELVSLEKKMEVHVPGQCIGEVGAILCIGIVQ